MFAVAGSLSVPRFTIVTRKAYGLGAMAMMGGQACGHHNAFHVSWPTAEAGPMNLEGAVALGFAKELTKAREAGGAGAEQALFDKLLAMGYERGGALSVARTLETDDVIDPAESRAWILNALEAASAGPEHRSQGRPWKRKRPCVSPW
jgi:acetyl-CoA carboxylase carboxyltransferase component